tara:strand:+ start:251 stop:1003 length:753 start_codon:yes stop_codon:yes gene_type:complete
MNFRYIILIFIFFVSCAKNTKVLNENKVYEIYTNKGFTLVYNDNLLKNKIVNKKIDSRSLILFNNNLNIDTPVKVTNLLNGKYLIAKVGNNSKYPSFYNSVISVRIAKELELDVKQPYVEIKSLNSNNTFIANKAKTYDEEKNVANKVPVEDIIIQNIGLSKDEKTLNKTIIITDFNYIIKFADLYFEDSAIMLKNRLFNEFKISKVKIKKISKNNYRVFKGPFSDLNSIKKAFNDINNLDFENIEIIKL